MPLTVDEYCETLRLAGIEPGSLTVNDRGTLRDAPTAHGEPVIELPPLAGDQLRILDRLGEGGYGVVDRAVQVPLNREVAVKRATGTSEEVRDALIVEAPSPSERDLPARPGSARRSRPLLSR